mmetsp:Transcript_25525/g.83714  ORF Transcript_25525/g.83714 Transcript_25525/m.83714 type:complete len:558 (-) Transcript_25525:1919-3592(-)
MSASEKGESRPAASSCLLMASSCSLACLAALHFERRPALALCSSATLDSHSCHVLNERDACASAFPLMPPTSALHCSHSASVTSGAGVTPSACLSMAASWIFAYSSPIDLMTSPSRAPLSAPADCTTAGLEMRSVARTSAWACTVWGPFGASGSRSACSWSGTSSCRRPKSACGDGSARPSCSFGTSLAAALSPSSISPTSRRTMLALSWSSDTSSSSPSSSSAAPAAAASRLNRSAMSNAPRKSSSTSCSPCKSQMHSTAACIAGVHEMHSAAISTSSAAASCRSSAQTHPRSATATAVLASAAGGVASHCPSSAALPRNLRSRGRAAAGTCPTSRASSRSTKAPGRGISLACACAKSGRTCSSVAAASTASRTGALGGESATRSSSRASASRARKPSRATSTAAAAASSSACSALSGQPPSARNSATSLARSCANSCLATRPSRETTPSCSRFSSWARLFRSFSMSLARSFWYEDSLRFSSMDDCSRCASAMSGFASREIVVPSMWRRTAAQSSGSTSKRWRSCSRRSACVKGSVSHGIARKQAANCSADSAAVM